MRANVREKIIGIYKIESPSGAIYIGQSVNIFKRWNDYFKVTNCHRQRKLFHSLSKYGAESHIFSIVCRFPKDAHPDILCAHEQFCIDQYKEAGYVMMNIRQASSRGGHSEETKKLMSDKQKGRKLPPGAIRKMSLAKKGKPGNRLGTKQSLESIEKSRIANTGRKHSEDAKIKISKNHSRHNLGKPASEESKQKNRMWHTGKVISEEQKQKTSAALKGKPKTKEHNYKVSEALKAYHINRRLLGLPRYKR